MKDHEQELHEIAQHERWLANLLSAEESPSIEHLKLRLRVAIDEHWLKRNLGECSEPVSDLLRGRIRHCLASRESQQAHAASNEARIWRRVMGVGLGLAATLFLSLMVFRSNKAEVTDTDISVVTAFEEVTLQHDDEGESGDLVAIDAELAELDALMASLIETDSDDVFEGL